jgi:hypothetical protein
MCRFYVKVKEDLNKAFQDFFPHMSSNYISTAKLFNKNKIYPVLAVESVTVFTKDGDEVESARFLVPSENNNFIWIQCELFEFAGFSDSGNSNSGADPSASGPSSTDAGQSLSDSGGVSSSGAEE